MTLSVSRGLQPRSARLRVAANTLSCSLSHTCFWRSQRIAILQPPNLPCVCIMRTPLLHRNFSEWNWTYDPFYVNSSDGAVTEILQMSHREGRSYNSPEGRTSRENLGYFSTEAKISRLCQISLDPSLSYLLIVPERIVLFDLNFSLRMGRTKKNNKNITDKSLSTSYVIKDYSRHIVSALWVDTESCESWLDLSRKYIYCKDTGVNQQSHH